MLIWTNFDSFADTCLIKVVYFESYIYTKGPETSFQVAVFAEFFDHMNFLITEFFDHKIEFY